MEGTKVITGNVSAVAYRKVYTADTLPVMTFVPIILLARSEHTVATPDGL